MTTQLRGTSVKLLVLVSIYSTFQYFILIPACKGSSLLTQLQNAIKMRAKHEALFAKFSERFSQEQLTQWTREIELWEEDPNSTNPYDEPDACKSLVILLLIYDII